MKNVRLVAHFAFVTAIIMGLMACGDAGNNTVGSNDLDGKTPTSSVSEPYSLDGDSEPENSGSEPESIGSIYDASASTLTDLRDGQTYRTTTISIPAMDYSEVWMAENLNYVTLSGYCYDNAQSNCAKYGRLYTWIAAVGQGEFGYVQDGGLPSGNIRGICPQGWHLPSRAEWEALLIAVGGSLTEISQSDYKRYSVASPKLKSASGWKESIYGDANGTDAYSFSALPAGYRDIDGYFDYEGYNAYFWSSTEIYSDYAFGIYLGIGIESDYADLNISGKYDGYSVRCLKD